MTFDGHLDPNTGKVTGQWRVNDPAARTAFGVSADPSDAGKAERAGRAYYTGMLVGLALAKGIVNDEFRRQSPHALVLDYIDDEIARVKKFAND